MIRELSVALGYNVEVYDMLEVSFPQSPLQNFQVLCILFAGHS